MSLRIGYFGEEGSFAHLASRRRFPDGAFSPFATVGEALEALLAKKVDLIVMPIENASNGIITDTVDQLIRYAVEDREQEVEVRECLAMRIHLALLSAGGETPQVIYSHPAALAHARLWLKKNFPETKLSPTANTAQAARLALAEPGAAALAGAQAGELYGLKTVRSDVEEEVANRTKFYVIGRRGLVLPNPTAPTHTSLLFELRHEPGSLVRVLTVLSDLGLNLTMIQSRPIPGRFDEYRFFIEFNGVADQAVDALRPRTHNLNRLGSYPILDLP